jgi:hypothetical protein
VGGAAQERKVIFKLHGTLIYARFTLVMKVVESGTGVDIRDPVECEVARAFIGRELDGSCHLADPNVQTTHIVARKVEGPTQADRGTPLDVPEKLQAQLHCPSATPTTP